MEDFTEYWLDYPPIFSNIDWTDTQTSTEFEQKIPPTLQHVPFQRRRSSSVDLPINPLYLNSNRFTFGNSPIKEEEIYIAPSKIGSSSTLEFPLNNNNNNDFDFNFTDALFTSTDEPAKKPVQQQPPAQPPTNTTFFPELHRTSYNTILGQQLQKHQKRRRSSSLPPVFKQQQKRVPTPLIFTQIQVTDPRPVQHTQKAAKVDAKPIPIERVVKKPAPVKPEECDPAEKQKKLDQALINLNFDDVTVAELKDMLKERGLPNTGKKAVLTERLKKVRDNLLNSPAIRGIANMTIHSPCPPTMEDPVIMDHPNYQYQSTDMNTDINELLDFNPLFQTNPAFTTEEQQKRPPLTSWDSEWDQDRLDHFLTELV